MVEQKQKQLDFLEATLRALEAKQTQLAGALDGESRAREAASEAQRQAAGQLDSGFAQLRLRLEQRRHLPRSSPEKAEGLKVG